MKNHVRLLCAALLLWQPVTKKPEALRLDPLDQVPFATVSSRALSVGEYADHALIFAGTVGRLDSPYRTLFTIRGRHDLCSQIDSAMLRSGLCHGNIASVRFKERVLTFAPHHFVRAFGGESSDREASEAFMEKMGWERVAKTELYVSSRRSPYRGFACIPSIGSAYEAVGETVLIEGIQFSSLDTPSTGFVHISGTLFRLPPRYYNPTTVSLTTSPLYGMKVRFEKGMKGFGGLSGSPVLYQGKAIGIQVGVSCSRLDKEKGRAVLLIQPLISRDMLPFMARKK